MPEDRLAIEIQVNRRHRPDFWRGLLVRGVQFQDRRTGNSIPLVLLKST